MIVVNKLYLKYIREYYALFDVNLEIKKGEKVALVGEESSGKTSLLRILAKLENFSSGEVYINNIPLKKISYKDDLSVGYLPVHPIFLKKKTVFQNLKYILKERKFDPNLIETKINNVLADLELDKFKDAYIENLSLFEQYLISIARLVLRDKIDLILIDDIFCKLTDSETEKILQILKQKFLSNPELTAVVATSDKELAQKIANKSIYFKSGSIVESL